MNLTEVLKKAGGSKGRKRLGRGRGSGLGKTSGRGNKGQRSRSGASRAAACEGGQMPMFRRLPKRGFNNAQYRIEYSVVNIGDLERVFPAGTHVTAQVLAEAGLIPNNRRRIKILGDGTVSKKLTVDAAKFSKSAMEKIAAAGGVANVMA